MKSWVPRHEDGSSSFSSCFSAFGPEDLRGGREGGRKDKGGWEGVREGGREGGREGRREGGHVPVEGHRALCRPSGDVENLAEIRRRESG